MEISQHIVSLLEQLPQPVFLVKDHLVVYANRGARLRDVQEKMNILDLITIGQQEYLQFDSGKLILTVTVAGIQYNTVLTKAQEHLMFCLESEYSKPELRAFAIAAQALRNPLSNVCLGIDGLLPEPSVQESPALLAQLKAVSRNIYQMHRAVRNMSDVAVIGASDNNELRDVVSLLTELTEKANTLLESTGHRIQFQPLTQPVCCQINSENLERAVLNLISNAVKYATDSQDISLSMRLGTNKLYISVQSHCEHAHELLSSNIFSGFTREPSIGDGHNGIGLGLTIVHSIAAAHKGALLVEHPDNNCLRFTISVSTILPSVCKVKSPTMYIENTGGFDNYLIELADILPLDAFR